MKDLTGELEAFIITNGRSTYEYAHRALLEQTCKFKITVLRDMKWVAALNKCIDLCESKYYLRCDDDHLLHPEAVLFMYKGMRKRPKAALFACALWEDWTKRTGGGTKMYNPEIVDKLGRFKANHLGKVDKVFRARLKKSPYKISGSKGSIMGLHSCAPMDEQIRYEKLWSQMATKAYKKTTHKQMRKYKKTVKDQYNMLSTFVPKRNKKLDTPFHQYLERRKS